MHFATALGTFHKPAGGEKKKTEASRLLFASQGSPDDKVRRDIEQRRHETLLTGGICRMRLTAPGRGCRSSSSQTGLY